MFLEPIEYCPVCDDYVLIDQTYDECAREHHCQHMHCPLKRFFTGHSFKDKARSRSDSAHRPKSDR